MPRIDSILFTPGSIGSLELRNRTIRAAAFEGMTPDGRPSEALTAYHRAVAEGGVGMTTVAYASVSFDGRTYDHQLCMQAPGITEGLRQLTDAVHHAGAAAAIQLGHGGYFAAPAVIGRKPIGPSPVFNTYGLGFPRQMTERDIEEVIRHFVRATMLAREAGFDAVELQAGHGYLLSQFLSPHTNRRGDRWGGSRDNRLRFPVAVLAAVREALGPDFPIMLKINLSDGFAGGQTLEDAVAIAGAFEAASADALVLSGGFVSKTPMYIMRGEVPFDEMYRGQTSLAKKIGLLLMGRVLVRRFDFTEAYFLEDAREVRRAVRMPLVLVGGLRRRAQMERILGEEGFDFVALARPLIMEPDLIARMQRGEVDVGRCQPCNRCIGMMDKGAAFCPYADGGLEPPPWEQADEAPR